MLSGIWRSFWILSIAAVASPKEAPGARLKEIVTTGNCPWRFTESGALLSSKWVKALRGTAAPFDAETGVGLAEPAVAMLVVGPAPFAPVDRTLVPEAPGE